MGAATARGRTGSPEPFPPPRLPGRSREDHRPFLSGCWRRLSGFSSAGSGRKTQGKVSCCERSLRERAGNGGTRDVRHGGAALLLPSTLEPSFSSSSPRSPSRLLGNIKSDLQSAILPPPPCPQHRDLILSHLNPPLPKELQQKLN